MTAVERLASRTSSNNVTESPNQRVPVAYRRRARRLHVPLAPSKQLQLWCWVGLLCFISPISNPSWSTLLSWSSCGIGSAREQSSYLTLAASVVGSDEQETTAEVRQGQAIGLHPPQSSASKVLYNGNPPKSVHRQGRPNQDTKSMSQILRRAARKGLGGGIGGALAGFVQVVMLMWLRTIVNYQSRYGTSFSQSMVTLLNEGGIRRLYRGLTFAIVQAPLSRFVSTAANDGIISLLANLTWTKEWGPERTTLVASMFVALWRLVLMPIDTMKTVLQVDSVEGFRNLMRRVRAGKIGVLFQGAYATALSAIAGHYPWFVVYNVLTNSEFVRHLIPIQLLRNAAIGLAASVVSDTTVNFLRVIKTTKQSLASKHSVSYLEVVRIIVAADGWTGLFGRSLRTRIVANALQSIVFTVIWRYLAEFWKSDASTKHHDEIR